MWINPSKHWSWLLEDNMGTAEIFLYPPTLMMKPSNFIKSFIKTLPKYNTKEPLDENQKPVNKMKKKSHISRFLQLLCVTRAVEVWTIVEEFSSQLYKTSIRIE